MLGQGEAHKFISKININYNVEQTGCAIPPFRLFIVGLHDFSRHICEIY